MKTFAYEIEQLKGRLNHKDRQISGLAAQLRAAGIVPIFAAAKLQARSKSESKRQLRMTKAKPRARSSSSTGKGGRKGKGKARQDAEPQHAEPKQSDNEAFSSKASSRAADSVQELGHSKTLWRVDE